MEYEDFILPTSKYVFSLTSTKPTCFLFLLCSLDTSQRRFRTVLGKTYPGPNKKQHVEHFVS